MISISLVFTLPMLKHHAPHSALSSMPANSAAYSNALDGALKCLAATTVCGDEALLKVFVSFHESNSHD
jgi:hypothetical protein